MSGSLDQRLARLEARALAREPPGPLPMALAGAVTADIIAEAVALDEARARNVYDINTGRPAPGATKAARIEAIVTLPAWTHSDLRDLWAVIIEAEPPEVVADWRSRLLASGAPVED